VGEKTARALVTSHPSLDAIVAAAGELRPAVGAALRASDAYLAAMRAVVPVRTDVEVVLRRSDSDPARLAELAEAHNLESPVQRLLDALNAR
jgi:hypothetical protein